MVFKRDHPRAQWFEARILIKHSKTKGLTNMSCISCSMPTAPLAPTPQAFPQMPHAQAPRSAPRPTPQPPDHDSSNMPHPQAPDSKPLVWAQAPIPKGPKEGRRAPVGLAAFQGGCRICKPAEFRLAPVRQRDRPSKLVNPDRVLADSAKLNIAMVQFGANHASRINHHANICR